MTLVPVVALRIGKFIINNASIYLKEEKIFCKLIYYTLCLGSANCQKSRWKVRLYINEKPTFLKEAYRVIITKVSGTLLFSKFINKQLTFIAHVLDRKRASMVNNQYNRYYYYFREGGRRV